MFGSGEDGDFPFAYHGGRRRAARWLLFTQAKPGDWISLERAFRLPRLVVNGLEPVPTEGWTARACVILPGFIFSATGLLLTSQRSNATLLWCSQRSGGKQAMHEIQARVPEPA